MADLTGITAIRPTANTRYELVQIGATVAIGNTLYQDSADDKFKLADTATEPLAKIKALAMTGGAADDYAIVATGGTVEVIGGTVVEGETYIVSDTAGGIKPVGDKLSNDFISYVGAGLANNQLLLLINATGAQVP